MDDIYNISSTVHNIHMYTIVCYSMQNTAVYLVGESLYSADGHRAVLRVRRGAVALSQVGDDHLHTTWAIII